MNKRLRWTQEEDEWLKNNYLKVGIDACVKVLPNRTKDAIWARVHQTFGLKLPPKWTDEQIDYLIKNYNTKPLAEIEQYLSKTKREIFGKAHGIGLKLGRYYTGLNKRRYSFNENYFEKIDSWEKAYWLGWIWSDGSINLTSRTLRFNLQKRDSRILEALRDSLESNYPLTTKKNNEFEYTCFSVGSPKMIDDLMHLNVKPNKTICQNIPNINEEFMDGFLLGIFDGDGSVYKAGRGYTRISFSGTKACMIFIRNFLMRKLNISIPEVREVIHTCLFARLDIQAQKDVKLVYEFLYKRAEIMLKRKESIFREANKFQYKEKKVPFDGVTKFKKRYMARIAYAKQKEFLGYFDTAEEASAAYQKRLAELNSGNVVIPLKTK